LKKCAGKRNAAKGKRNNRGKNSHNGHGCHHGLAMAATKARGVHHGQTVVVSVHLAPLAPRTLHFALALNHGFLP